MKQIVLAFSLIFSVACAVPLVARHKRDVSHLPLEYLSPVVLPPLPSHAYLPPVEEQAAPHLNHAYLPPTTTTSTTTTTTTTEAPPAVKEAVKPSNEYLPPAPLEPIVVTEAVPESEPEPEPQSEPEPEPEPTTTSAPIEEAVATTETVTEANTEPAVTEVNTEPAPEPEPEPESEPVAEPEPVPEAVPESAVLEYDGYHYRKPDVIPDLLSSQVPADEESIFEPLQQLTGEYLPPLEEGVVVAVGPPNDETAVLADDGYHYRAIKRLRF